MDLKPPSLDGALLASRYAYMPNKLRYCGGDNNGELFNYAAAGQSDPGLKELLKEFATMYPYLRLIAEANKIIDPFNYRVVEAYWLGNDLLNNVSMKNFYRYLVDEQQLKKKLKPKLLEKVFGKIALGAKPHHNWHVFNIPKRTGNYPMEHTLQTLDECRIAWAKVKSQKLKVKNGFLGKITVEYQPLVMMGNNLTLGEPREKEVFCEINEKAFVKEPKVGDLVSIHWSWVCDFLTPLQAQNLKKWTQYNLNLVKL